MPKQKLIKIYGSLFILGLIFFLAVNLFSSFFKKNSYYIYQQQPLEKIPWHFAIIADTQAVDDQNLFDRLFAIIEGYHPQMIIHLGDADWSSDFNRQPLKGLLTLRSSSQNQTGFPLEIHLAPGNHDDEGVCSQLKEFYRQMICESTPPFNPEVYLTSSYCSKNSVFHQYSFERGKIKFIILDMPFYCANTSAEKKVWLEKEICSANNANITLAFLHENAFTDIKNFLDNLPCQNTHNLKAIFMGHGHEFNMENYKGIFLVELTGAFWIRGDYNPNLENDFFIAKVERNKISFIRTNWPINKSDSNPPLVVFSLNGDFESYFHPCESDFDKNRKINFSDLLFLLNHWNNTPQPFGFLRQIMNRFNKDCL